MYINFDVAIPWSWVMHIHIFSGSLPLEIPISSLMVGANSLQIVVMDGEGASVTITRAINIDPPPATGKVVFTKDHHIIHVMYQAIR